MDNTFKSKLSQLILDSNPLAVIVIDQNREFVDCNEAALKLFKTEAKEHLLENHFLYSAPIQPNGMFAGELARTHVDAVTESGEHTASWVYKDKNGELIPCEIILKKIEYNEEYIIIKYIRDLREEIKTQAEVREITERNKIMIDVTTTCFVFFDDEFNIVDCNPAALSLFGIKTIKTYTMSFPLMGTVYA